MRFFICCVFSLCSLLSDAMDKRTDTESPHSVIAREPLQQRGVRAAELVQKDCCEAIKANKLDDAVLYFRQSLENANDSPSGTVFEIIIKGLSKAKYLNTITVEDYGISNSSRKMLKSISDEHLKRVFSAIHSFLQSHSSFSIKEIEGYFSSYFK